LRFTARFSAFVSTP